MDRLVSGALETFDRLASGFVAFLPRFVLALALLTLFVLVARGGGTLARRYAARRRGHFNLAVALGRLAQGTIIVIGFLLAVTAAFPTFTPGDLVTTLGIGGLAIGIAFKDIFENFLAGILILVTRPFVVGDQIIYGSYEGTVEDIQTRATLMETYDGRRVVIPNGELYTNPVTVNTAFPKRRWEYDIGIGYGDDVERARAIVLDVLEQADDVAPDPKADVIVVDFTDFGVKLRARWWTDSRIGDGLLAQDRVLAAVKRELLTHGIDLPFPTHQILFHDQTEETDGDRARQREGWPAVDGEVPEPRTIAAALRRLDQRMPGA